MFCFGIIHFKYSSGVAKLIPACIPLPVFWAYLTGIALTGAAISIAFDLKSILVSKLLAIMILIWFTILHVPRVLSLAGADHGAEIGGALSALMFAGTALSIAHLRCRSRLVEQNRQLSENRM